MWDFTQLLDIRTAIGSIISIIVAYIFYKKNQKMKKPVFDVKTQRLIKDYAATERLSGLSISFNGEQVKSLSVTKIALWNFGSQTIERSDITTKDPVRIQVEKDIRVYDARAIDQTSEANEFNAKIQDSSIAIDFAFLDRNQGGIVQIIHNGTRRDLKFPVVGIIKGAKLKRKKLVRSGSKYHTILGGLCVLCGFYFLTYLPNQTLIGQVVYYGLTYLLLGCIVIYISSRRTPKGLQSFFEEF